MIRSTLTIEQLRIREHMHRQNSQISRPISGGWNKIQHMQDEELAAYKYIQEQLADVFTELIFYREADISYNNTVHKERWKK